MADPVRDPEYFLEEYLKANERIVTFCESRDPEHAYVLRPTGLTSCSIDLVRISKVPRYLLGAIFDKQLVTITYDFIVQEGVKLSNYNARACPLRKQEIINAAQRGQRELADRLEKRSKEVGFS